MKFKEFGPWGASLAPPLDPPLKVHSHLVLIPKAGVIHHGKWLLKSLSREINFCLASGISYVILKRQLSRLSLLHSMI